LEEAQRELQDTKNKLKDAIKSAGQRKSMDKKKGAIYQLLFYSQYKILLPFFKCSACSNGIMRDCLFCIIFPLIGDHFDSAGDSRKKLESELERTKGTLKDTRAILASTKEKVKKLESLKEGKYAHIFSTAVSRN
jgi:ElaB/YqjD/DUF883 family membrane-anchored ribosome-binding protein